MPEATSDASLAPRAFRKGLGFDFGFILVPFWLQKDRKLKKNKLNFEAILEAILEAQETQTLTRPPGVALLVRAYPADIARQKYGCFKHASPRKRGSADSYRFATPGGPTGIQGLKDLNVKDPRIRRT